MKINNTKAKEKNWVLKSTDTHESIENSLRIAEALGLDPIITKLLYSRGYTDVSSCKSFIYMEEEMLCNPFDMIDMEKAVERIRHAVDSNEKITVYGDYDVDGVTAVCSLYLYLRSKGANIEYYIPNRVGEGYGVSKGAIDTLKQNGTSLIITVDTGITANDEVLYAKDVGIDFVITDHHECRNDLPMAEAVVNPHRPDCPYPFKELAGVGVVFKLICAYEEKVEGLSKMEACSRIFSEYADLVAIGTIADVMPIKDENRIIVSYGLRMIEVSPRPGLAALIEASSVKGEAQRNDKRKKRTKITSGYIGYTLAPRINAAGRIRTATIAVELFLEDDYSKAFEIAETLCKANKERQNEENKIMIEAYEKIEQLDIDNNPVIVLDADTWHHGVIGIVSSRITEKYSRPSILVSFEGNEAPVDSNDAVGKGSGRSVKGMNLVDALLYCSEYLVKFGGHELAAGLSVTRGNLDAFKLKINEYAKKNLKEEDMVSTIETDLEIQFDNITIALAEGLHILEPYGVGNPIPVFMLRDVTVSEIVGISDNKHTRFTLTNGNGYLSAMYFSNSPSSLGLYVGDRVDVLFNIDVNEWLGRKSVQLILRDVKPSLSNYKIEESNKVRFEEIKSGASFRESENVLPSRDDFAVVYRLMLSSLRNGITRLTHKDILSKTSSTNIGYLKLKFIIMVLKELNLVMIDENEDEVYDFNIHYSSSKSDLEKSNLLKKLRSQLEKNT